jgi:predicted nucleotidyltransferase
MIDVTEDVLQQMVDAIAREVDPEQIILFGSRGRGEDSARSDVDLMIIEREAFGQRRSRRRETMRIREALWDFDVPIDILVFSSSEVERWRHSLNHVIARALREGRVLYARS